MEWLKGTVDWLASNPLTLGFLTLAGQLWLNRRFKQADEARDEARAETQAKRDREAKWRDAVERKFAAQDTKIEVILRVQLSQMRSDLIHKAHRYLDDLGMASTEEKEALHAEYEEYTQACEAAGVENHYIDGMMERVMALPGRRHDGA